MKSWEDKIREDEDLFDYKELPEGHFERFEALLDKHEKIKQKTSKRFKLITAFSIVASIAILIGAGLYFTSIDRNKNFNNTDTEIPNEFYTTNEYYKQQMFEQIDNIMCKLDQTDAETRKQLTQDIESIINENSQFVNDMQENKNEEMAIFYMVEHYKTNIQALEFINEKLGNYFEC